MNKNEKKELKIQQALGTAELKCFAGNDGTLQYWFECSVCKTVIVIDYSTPLTFDPPWECPTCHPQENFAHQYYSKKYIEAHPELKEVIETEKRIGLI